MSRLRTTAKAASTLVFRGAERLGVHVAPAHYYSSTPDRRWLRANEAVWRKPASLVGVGWDLDEQEVWLRSVVNSYPAETPVADVLTRAEAVGGFRYGPIEAQVLHSVVRSTAPRRIFEIGSGSSTQVSSRAVAMNVAEGRTATEIVAVDPYMDPRVADLPHVEVRKVGGLELTQADLGLEAGDLLFIDSTHVVKTGSELPLLYLELLPAWPQASPSTSTTSTCRTCSAPASTTVSSTGRRPPWCWRCWSATTSSRPRCPRCTTIAPGSSPTSAPSTAQRRPTAASASVDADHHFPSSLWLETVA